jgi:hypothetical protein
MAPSLQLAHAVMPTVVLSTGFSDRWLQCAYPLLPPAAGEAGPFQELHYLQPTWPLHAQAASSSLYLLYAQGQSR